MLSILKKIKVQGFGDRRHHHPWAKAWSFIFLSYFEKNSSYAGGLRGCIFVALCVRMCVAGANK